MTRWCFYVITILLKFFVIQANSVNWPHLINQEKAEILQRQKDFGQTSENFDYFNFHNLSDIYAHLDKVNHKIFHSISVERRFTGQTRITRQT